MVEMKGGLQKTPKDKRDISVGAVLRFPTLEELPKNGIGILKPLKIKDQGDDDTCAARSSDAVSEDQEGTLLCDYFTFALAKFIDGDPESWGTNLRSVAKAHTKYGALAQEDCQQCQNNSHELSRDRDWNTWESKEHLLELAKKYKKASYLKIDGPYDVFDNIRATLYLMRTERRSSFTGALWKYVWTTAPNGFIPKFDLNKGEFGHSFKIFDWKEVEGELYLTAQLSNGTDTGDKGIFYFPRNVVNKEFTYGSYTFSDIPIGEVKKRGWSLQIKLLNFLREWNFLKSWKIPAYKLFA